MLNKQRSNKVAVLKYGLIFPMFLGMLIFASAFIANGENIAGILEKINENIVTGEIRNEENRPVVGASVVIRGEYVGAVTDLNGAFKIKISKPNSVIVISHIGYEGKEISIYEQKSVSVTLKKQISSLMETVVVAYSPNFFKDTINTEPTLMESVKGEIFSIVEQNAEFPGGKSELAKFLQRNLQYPKEAQRNNVQGKVFAKFVVEADGEISNISILKGLGYGLDEETVRVIGKMPNWNPGKQNGRPVNSEFSMPVSFVLEGGETPKLTLTNKNETIYLNEIDLFYINGKEVTRNIVQAIEPTSIKDMHVTKGEWAIKKFGEKGKNGVLEIGLKTENEVYADKNKFEKQPIYFLNGVEISLAKVKELDEAKIRSVTVVTKNDAIPKYGEKGKDGVVEIITKNKTTNNGKSFILDTKNNASINPSFYVVDGNEVTKKEFENIPANIIKSLSVLKGIIAVKKYGEKGKDGVVEIITKDNATAVEELAKVVQSKEEVFTVVDENAEFPGGQGAMGKFLAKNLKYPEPAQRANVSGKVFLTFVVKTNGEIEDIQVLKGMGFGLDAEAIRVIKAMPKWIPAKVAGKAVNSKFNLPISFNLSKK